MSRQIITAPRASTIIYGLAAANNNGVWLLPANVCPAVPLALIQAGADFEFIDIDPASFCMSIAALKKRASDKTRPAISGLIYVHAYGFAANAKADLAALRAALPRPALLIDDQCLGLPKTDFDAMPSGDVDAVIFSTGAGKVLDLNGGGYGVLFGDIAYALPPPMDEKLAAQNNATNTARYKTAMQAKRSFFEPGADKTIAPWVCGSPDIEWAAMQKSIDERLPGILAHKKALNQIYHEGLTGLRGLSPLPAAQQLWRYNVRAQNRDEFLALLFDKGLFASAHYYPASALFGRAHIDDQHYPQTDAVHDNILNLFNDLNFTEEQARHVVSLARDFYSQ